MEIDELIKKYTEILNSQVQSKETTPGEFYLQRALLDQNIAFLNYVIKDLEKIR